MVKPVLQALLVADHVYTDKETGKRIVAGVFDRLFFRKLGPIQTQISDEGKATVQAPAAGFHAGSPFCYINLTGVRGNQPFQLRYVDLEDDKGLFQIEFSIEYSDPLRSVEIAVPLPPLPADKAGTFALELLWNQEPLGSHRIVVVELGESEG